MNLDISTVRKRFDDCVEDDSENREEALDDMNFAVGIQWPEDVKRQREADGRPLLTINRMPQFIRQVTGDIRRTNPAIKVVPGDGKADADMAEIIAGHIRAIEYACDATDVYERAGECAATCGMGHFRAYTTKGDDGSECVIEAIPNPFAVYWDPLAKEPTRKDARFCFVTDEMSLEDFKAQYPKADAASFEGDGTVEHLKSWWSGDVVTVAEYIWKEDGKVFWAILSGVEVLDGPRELPCSNIPVFPVFGEEIHIGQRTIRSSVIRYAKDSQRRYNYWASAHAEMVALQPKAPWVLTDKQYQGNEQYWDNANIENLPVLIYKPDERAPPPQRQAPPVSSSGMMQEIMLSADDMKATTGIYDAALGDQGNEKSGVAIQRRQIESDISTSIYVDNLAKAIAQCGRVLVEMIQRTYDTTRTIRTIGEDGAEGFEDINVPMVDEQGPFYANAPATGKFDVKIATGPSYTTQRQEAAESMMEFMRVYPQAAPVIADLVAGNMDWPGSDQVAERLRKMLPPGVVEPKDPSEMTPQEMQAMQQQQQMAQMQQQMQQMQAELQMRKAQADISKAEADAAKTAAEVQETQVDTQGQQLDNAQKQMELAAQNGQLQAMVAQMVEQQVRQIMASQMRPAF